MKLVWGFPAVFALATQIGAVMAEEMDVLRMNGYEYAALVAKEKDKKLNAWTFVLQQGYRIEGREMGFPKPVGTVKRLYAHLCGSDTATLAITNAEDMAGNRIDLVVKESAPVLLTSDPDLLRAARYVCGDRSAKLPPYPGPTKGDPKYDKVVSCSLGKGEPLAFTLNEKARTVDDDAALFGPRTVKFALFGSEPKDIDCLCHRPDLLPGSVG